MIVDVPYIRMAFISRLHRSSTALIFYMGHCTDSDRGQYVQRTMRYETMLVLEERAEAKILSDPTTRVS